MSDYVVGISGGIGSGKTTVSDLFASLGIDVIDADLIAREVVMPGSVCLDKIIEKFGPQVVLESGQLDRACLRDLIFQNDELRTWLDKLLHPVIRQQMKQQTEFASSAYCLLSAPLLVENGLFAGLDRVLIVDVSEEIQLERTLARDKVSEQQVRAIIDSQASRSERLAHADDVIDNSAKADSLLAQVQALHQDYLARAEQKKHSAPV